MLEMKVKLLHSEAKLPIYAKPGDSGLDLFSIETKVIAPHEVALVHTGIAIEIPKNYEAELRPRSGLALDHQVTILNSPGTIDNSYRGEIGVILINHGEQCFQVNVGMKIAQLVIKRVFRVSVKEADRLSTTIRNHGGFGSTGK